MTERQLIKELEKRDIRYFKSSHTIMMNCIFHGEKNPSLGVSFKKDKFHCFSCGVVGNIDRLKKALFEDDTEIIEEDFNESEAVQVLKSTDRLRKRLDNLGTTSKLKIKVLIHPNFFNNYPLVNKGHIQYYNYLRSRNINYTSVKKFDIRCGYWKGVERVLVPMRDEHKRLIAIYGRSITDDKTIRIRKSKDADTGMILFGLEHLKKRRTIVLVEGEFDAIYLQQYGVPAVSIGTKKPTEIQLMKMVKYCSKVILTLDGDVPEKTIRKRSKLILGINDITKFIREVIPVKVIRLPIDKDPNELSINEVKTLFREFIK